MGIPMTEDNSLDEAPYNEPLIYSDESTLLDLYSKLVRTHGWKEDYLAPAGASWPNIRVWNGDQFDSGYVGKGDARVNLIVQSPEPPFKLVVGYNIGEEYASMDADYRIKRRVNKAFKRTRETLAAVSDIFETDSVVEYRVLLQSVDSTFEEPHKRTTQLQQSISQSLDQPDRTFGYVTYPQPEKVGRDLVFHDSFPSDEADIFRRLLSDDF